MLHSSYNNIGIVFAVTMDGHDIHFREWSATDDCIYYFPLANLVDNGYAKFYKHECTVPYENIYLLDEEDKTILGVPGAYDKAMRIRGTGLLNSKDFKYKIDFLSHVPDGNILVCERGGNILICSGNKYLLSESQYELINKVELYNNTSDSEKNYKRGLMNIASGHGRTMEFPQVFITIEGYSARVIREFYTHIGGAPTRLQASTRYINYKDFDYIIPPKILKNEQARQVYIDTMCVISENLQELEKMEIPREDSALLLPLGMTTKIACKHNFRNLVDMSHQRLCTRAYWEYRELFRDMAKALSEYSDEWKILVDAFFKPKCEVYGFCSEEKGCGRVRKKEVKHI